MISATVATEPMHGLTLRTRRWAALAIALVPQQSPRVPDWGGCHPAGSTTYKWDPTDPSHITYVDAAGKPVLVLPNDTDGHTFVTVTSLSGKPVMVPVWTVNGATCYAQ